MSTPTSPKNHPMRLLLLILAWALVVLGGYYYYHKPVSLEMLAAPLNALLDLFFLALFAGLAGGLGRKVLPAAQLPALERSALQFAMGAGLLSLAWLGIGAAGLYRFPLAAPLLLLGPLLLRRDALGWYAQLRELSQAWHDAGRLEKALAGAAALLLFYQLLIALAPPTSWDALAYHLQLPRQYLAAGGLVFTPENPYWGQPQMGEMLYTLAMSFHRAETAAALGWLAGLIFLIGLLGLTNSQWTRLNPLPASGRPGTSAGWMAVAAVLAGYTFRFQMSSSYTDLFAALFGLAAVTVFLAWLDGRLPQGFAWAGVLCGFALGAKWTAGVLAVGIFAGGLIFRRRAALSFRGWLLAGLAAALAVSPWLLKNWIATGGPLYPYLVSTPWMSAARVASANQFTDPVDVWAHILLPFSSTWAGIDAGPGFGTDLGPLLLLFSLPGLWRFRRSPQAQAMALLLLPVGIALGLGSLVNGHLMQTRLYYAALTALALPCGWGWAWLQGQNLGGVRLRRILGALVALVMGLVIWQDSFILARTTPARVVLGVQSSQSYLENTLGYHILAVQSLEKLPPGSRALLLWEPRGFYAPLDAQADPWIDRWRTDRRELLTAPAVLAHWKEQGFTHLLIFQQGPEWIKPQPGQPPSADWSELQVMLASLPAPTPIGSAYVLYQLP